jgi:hypothetical protein
MVTGRMPNARRSYSKFDRTLQRKSCGESRKIEAIVLRVLRERFCRVDSLVRGANIFVAFMGKKPFHQIASFSFLEVLNKFCLNFVLPCPRIVDPDILNHSLVSIRILDRKYPCCSAQDRERSNVRERLRDLVCGVLHPDRSKTIFGNPNRGIPS